MTEPEILEAAAKQADRNGFGMMDRLAKLNSQVVNASDWWLNKRHFIEVAKEPHSLIFDHAFAKAFWKNTPQKNNVKMEPWRYHLQRMVLAVEPIKYLALSLE